MAKFVRKNLLILTGRFIPKDGSTSAPNYVSAVLTYTNTVGLPQTDTVALSLNATTNTWLGTWDSSNAKEGRVDWMLYSTGPVQASTEGYFMVVANAANRI